MPDSNQVKSKRDIAMERMKGKYPDENFDDDEALFGRINDDYDDYDKKLAESQSREQAFSNMFTSDPRSARLMMEWKNGSDPAVALLRIYGDDVRAALDDPAKLEEIEQANKEFAEKVAKETEYEDSYNKNIQESLSALDKWAEERGFDDGTVDKVMENLSAICRDFLLGKFTPQTLDMIYKAQNYDADVEQSRHEGEVAGRNAKIEEKLRKSKKGDGTAQLDGKNSNTPPAPPRRDLGALDRYDGSKESIWERGKPKRTSHK